MPEDLALTGWDNILMSDLVSPPLTTVHQPAEELGAAAARTLLALIDGRPVSHDTLLPTTNIYRQSCGCAHQTLSDAGAGDDGGMDDPATRRDAGDP